MTHFGADWQEEEGDWWLRAIPRPWVPPIDYASEEEECAADSDATVSGAAPSDTQGGPPQEPRTEKKKPRTKSARQSDDETRMSESQEEDEQTAKGDHVRTGSGDLQQTAQEPLGVGAGDTQSLSRSTDDEEQAFGQARSSSAAAGDTESDFCERSAERAAAEEEEEEREADVYGDNELAFEPVRLRVNCFFAAELPGAMMFARFVPCGDGHSSFMDGAQVVADVVDKLKDLEWAAAYAAVGDSESDSESSTSSESESCDILGPLSEDDDAVPRATPTPASLASLTFDAVCTPVFSSCFMAKKTVQTTALKLKKLLSGDFGNRDNHALVLAALRAAVANAFETDAEARAFVEDAVPTKEFVLAKRERRGELAESSE